MVLPKTSIYSIKIAISFELDCIKITVKLTLQNVLYRIDRADKIVVDGDHVLCDQPFNTKEQTRENLGLIRCVSQGFQSGFSDQVFKTSF